MTLQMVLKDTLLNGDRRNKALLSSRKNILNALNAYLSSHTQTEGLCVLTTRDIPPIDPLIRTYLIFKGRFDNASEKELRFPFQHLGSRWSFYMEEARGTRLRNPNRREFLNALIAALTEI